MNNNKNKKKRKKIQPKNFVLIIIISAITLFSIITLTTAVKSALPISKDIDYQELMELIENKEVDSIVVNKQTNEMRVTTKDNKVLAAVNPQNDEFILDLMKAGVSVTVKKTGLLEAITNAMVSIFSFSLMIFIIFIFASNFSGINTKIFTLLKAKDNNVTFDNIRGLTETKKEVQFIIENIANYKELAAMGARPCKGFLLEGPPGTGKTMLAKAIANEAGVAFISASGSDFEEMFVGLGAARVRALWELASANAPCILFLDEIDCVGQKRSGSDAAGMEHNQTLNALLQKMDGLNDDSGIFVIGATNRKEVLDPAILRPGRFDRQYYIGPPDCKKDRDDVVEEYLLNKGKKLAEDVTLDKASKLLVGLSGAEIEQALNEAVYVSLQDKRDGVIKLADIDEAVMKMHTSGVKKEHSSERDREVSAYHEAGHAIVSLLLGLPVSKVTISAYSSGPGGMTVRDMDDISDTKLKLESEYIKDIKIALAGKIAETIKYGEHTQGCSSDIKMTTKMIYNFVTCCGFNNERLANENVFIEDHLQLNVSKETLDECNEKLKNIDYETTKLLKNNFELVEALAKKLLKETTIVVPTIDEIKSWI